MKKVIDFLKTKKGMIILASTLVVIAAIIVVILLMTGGEGDKDGIEDKAYRTISVSEIYGTVTVDNNGNKYDAYANMNLKEGYALTTEKESYVRMVLDGDKYIKLEEESKASFDSLGEDNSGYTVISLEYGVITNEISSALSEDEDYIINTPNAVLAVRGTFFRVEVAVSAEGETLTDVYTYGGMVKSQRILPTGEMVEEDVLIDAGYKTTISMDADETIYVVEKVEEGKENTEPFTLAEIPEADLVDMYVASINGHDMFVNTEDIWYSIETREIDVEDYTSNRDGEKVPVYDKEVSHEHIEKTVTKDATCTEEGHTMTICTVCGNALSDSNIPPLGHTEVESRSEKTCTEDGFERVECSVCKEVLSEVIETATGHTEETTIVPATETEPGKTTVKCSVCQEILSEVEIPINHTHTEETVTVEATCSNTGKKTTRCSVCLEVFSETTIPKLEHTVVEETTEATFASSGSYRKYCSVCNATLEAKTLDKLPAIYTDGGDIFITGRGYYTSSNTKLVPYTGDYKISQKNSSSVECSIYIEGGTHKVTLDGINITGCLDISAEAVVNIEGTSNKIYITSTNGVAAINNSATLTINSGNITAESNGYAMKSIGTASINGGSISLKGSLGDVNADKLYILGGSVRLVNNLKTGSVYNGNTELEWEALSTYPYSYELEFVSTEGDTYSYSLNKEDVASDGKYYIWKPAGDLVINEKTFPDKAIRVYVEDYFDLNHDMYLSDEEIASAIEIYMDTEYAEITSFTGIRHLTGLKSIQCYNKISAKNIELRTLTELEILALPGAPLSYVETYNCRLLKELNLADTDIISVNLDNNPEIEILDIRNTDISILNIIGCNQLTELHVDGTLLSGLELMSQHSTLEILTCANAPISYLDIGACKALKTLDITNCPLPCINIGDAQVSASNFKSGNNVYGNVALTGTSYNASNIIGVDISKISNVTGADYDASTGMFTNISGSQLEYVYDCGNGVVAEFVITFYIN